MELWHALAVVLKHDCQSNFCYSTQSSWLLLNLVLFSPGSNTRAHTEVVNLPTAMRANKGHARQVHGGTTESS
eukprot:4398738-Amphidinium_carterae.1